MVEHNDYLAFFEMKKKVVLAQKKFTDYVIERYLQVDINDKSDWRNYSDCCISKQKTTHTSSLPEKLSHSEVH